MRSMVKKKQKKTPREAHMNFLNGEQIGLFRQMIRLGLKGVWPRWGFAEKRTMQSALEKMDRFLDMTGKSPAVSFQSIISDL